ncbi:cadherin repeat domain-containing protein [Symmachiella macrocystis]|uniref:cadherin repeat domain-containing protein n=1 Tax=Symmachiella macrocystis TaxID=2527985 RepID=UPI0018D448E3|nr:cadherin repeat domain-containing protein [Symmachiella macrocystis]
MRISLFITTVLAISAQTGMSDETPSADAPVQPQGPRFSVAENSPVGTTVGTVTSKKGTNPSLRTYSITSGNEQQTFVIHAKTGRIAVRNSTRLDYETNPEYVLQVTVEGTEDFEDSFDSGFAAELRKSGINVNDDKQLIETLSVTIEVKNVNEFPALEKHTLSIAENSAASVVVGRVLVSDPDAGDTLLFFFNNDNATSPFRIDPRTGEITVIDPTALDYEIQTDYEMNVVVIDAGGAALSETLRIEVTNINEPPHLAAETFTLPEASNPGTVVGRIPGVDPDGEAALTYAIVRGNDDNAFVINELTGEISVAQGAALDFEQTPQRQIGIEARDAQGDIGTTEVQIELTDVNEPPVAGNQEFALPDHIESGAVIGTISANDPDQGELLTFGITDGNDDGAFAIDPRTGELTVVSPEKLNARSARQAALSISIADRTEASATATATIDLGIAQADSSLAAAIRAMSSEDEDDHGTANPVDSQTAAVTPKPTPKAKPVPPVTPQVATQATTPAAVTTATPTNVVPASNKRAAASWLLLCIGGAAVVWGGVLVLTSLHQRRMSATLRKSIAAAHHDEELLHERMLSLDAFSNELRAERDELMATRRLLTGEFEKLKSLLGRQTEELRSTDTVLQHGDEILQKQMATAAAPTAASGAADESLDSVRREFAEQHQRLGTLQETMEQRDRELIDTCSKMDTRLEEVLQKVSLIDAFDELQQGCGDDLPPSDEDDVAGAHAMAAWDKRQTQIYELEQQFDGDPGEPSSSGIATKAALPNETSMSKTAIEMDYSSEPPTGEHSPDEHITEEMQQKWAARTELNTLRSVANESTRTTLAKYSRKKFFRSKLLLGSLGLFGVSFASLLWLGGLGAKASQTSLGWGALGASGVAMVLLVSSWLKHRSKS